MSARRRCRWSLAGGCAQTTPPTPVACQWARIALGRRAASRPADRARRSRVACRPVDPRRRSPSGGGRLRPAAIRVRSSSRSRTPPRTPCPSAGLSLRIGTASVALAPLESSLAPGERLLVALDGPKDPAEPCPARRRVPSSGPQDPSSSSRRQRSPPRCGRLGQGPCACRVAVGGDFALDDVAPGTIDRPASGRVDPFQPTDWVPYPPASATPGAAEPGPALRSSCRWTARSWTPRTALWPGIRSVGAASYRVQVAPDDTFAAPPVDTTVSEPQIDVSSLAAGHYLWRVQAIGPDGAAVGDVGAERLRETAGIVRIAPAAFHPCRSGRRPPACASTMPLKHLGVALARPAQGHRDAPARGAP